jgi:dipeptidase D
VTFAVLPKIPYLLEVDKMHQKTREILGIFEQINRIPRCSKQEKRISLWLQQWAQDNGFKSWADGVGNLVIEIPATQGCEGGPTIVIQGHMDMVCEKTPDSNHDFSKDPIGLVYDGDWLKADRTTLGADNGIGVAIGLALAVDKTVAHPPLELLFTVDEESGLKGAKELETGFVRGKILLNIDSENEGIFTVGCAGGVDTTITLLLSFSPLPQNHDTYTIMAHGMRGGHSGIDINGHRANANKILARALHLLRKSLDVRLACIKGGSAHNVIPREAEAVITCDPSQFSLLQSIVSEFAQTARKEHASTEPSLTLTLSEGSSEILQSLTREDTDKVIHLLLALPHGVEEMSADIEGLVETSNNLATVEIKDKTLHILSSQRSSITSRLHAITSRIEATGALANAEAKTNEGYPAWQPNMDSHLLMRCKEVYKSLFSREPVVEIIHAGLECGIIGSKYPGMDMISFGPTIENPHSPGERIYVPSIGKVWDFLVVLLDSYTQ